jgi:hypothetical protein
VREAILNVFYFLCLILRSRVSGVSKEDPVVSGEASSFETLRSSG